MLLFYGFVDDLLADEIHIQVVHQALDNFAHSAIVAEFVVFFVVAGTDLLVGKLHRLEADIERLDFILGLQRHSHFALALLQHVVAVIQGVGDFAALVLQTFIGAIDAGGDGVQLAAELIIDALLSAQLRFQTGNAHTRSSVSCFDAGTARSCPH